MIWWMILGAMLIVVLSGVAMYYLWLLRNQRRNEKVRAELRAETRSRNRSSVYIIAKALLEDQVSYTEASIRISVLLRSCDISDDDIADYSVFYQLAEATSHIPILDAWRELSKSEKKRFDRERESLEEKYRDFIVPAAEKLVKNFR